MTAVIRRVRSVPSTRVEPAPVVERTLSPEELRERLLRARSQRLHDEVLEEFRRLGAIDNGDPMTEARGEYRAWRA